jgi:hypothetical protein
MPLVVSRLSFHGCVDLPLVSSRACGCLTDRSVIDAFWLAATVIQPDLGVTRAGIACRRVVGNGGKSVELLLVSSHDEGYDDSASTKIPFGGTLTITGMLETCRESLPIHPSLPQALPADVVQRLQTACSRFETLLGKQQAEVRVRFCERMRLSGECPKHWQCRFGPFWSSEFPCSDFVCWRAWR